MLSKSILIGLFVLKNNSFSLGGYGRHREMEEFSAQMVLGGPFLESPGNFSGP